MIEQPIPNTTKLDQRQQIIQWLDRIEYSSPIALTLTFKRDRTSNYSAQKALSKFFHNLDRAVYAKAYKRYGKRVPRIVVQEGDLYSGTIHFHAQIDTPAHMRVCEFINLLKSLWEHGIVDAVPETQGNWLQYMCKWKSKPSSEPFSDSLMLDQIVIH